MHLSNSINRYNIRGGDKKYMNAVTLLQRQESLKSEYDNILQEINNAQTTLNELIAHKLEIEGRYKEIVELLRLSSIEQEDCDNSKDSN